MSRWLLIRLAPAGPSGFESCGGTLLVLAIILGVPGALIYHSCGFDKPTPEQVQQQIQFQKDVDARLKKGREHPYWGLVVHNFTFGEDVCLAHNGAKAVYFDENPYSGTADDIIDGSPAQDAVNRGDIPRGDARYIITHVGKIRVYNVRDFRRAFSANAKATGGKSVTINMRWDALHWVYEKGNRNSNSQGSCQEMYIKTVTLTR